VGHEVLPIDRLRRERETRNGIFEVTRPFKFEFYVAIFIALSLSFLSIQLELNAMSDANFGTAPFLIIGSKGQLGQALMSLLPGSIGIWREQIDLSKPNLADVLAKQIRDSGPIGGIINAAAYTAVDKAESEIALANQINGNAPGQIATFCADQDLPMVHISTDYVFSGQSEKPYLPEQETAPINAYGQSKLLGEIAIEKTEANAAILRTSWVYDGHNSNFLTTMLRLSETRDTLNVVNDQIGRPTYTVDLAEASIRALKGLIEDHSKKGIYHVSNTGPAISWAQFARAIFESTGTTMTVNDIPASEFPTPAARPAYSVMETAKFEEAFDYNIPNWKDGLIRAVATR